LIGRAHEWSRFRVTLLAISFALMIVEGYDVQVLAYAAPLILKDWHVTQAEFGSVFGAGLFSYMIGATLLTGFADRIGRKPVVVVGAAAFGVFTFAGVFVSSITELFVLRILAGFGLGVAIPTIMALNAEFAPRKVRSAWLTSLAVGYALGGSLGGVVVAPAMAHWGWQAAFVAGGAAPLLVAVLLAALLPESVEILRRRGADPARIAELARRYDLPAEVSADQPSGAENVGSSKLPVFQLFAEGRAALTLLVWGTFVNQKGIPFQQAVFIGSLLLGGSVVGGPIIGLLVDRFGGVALAIAYFLSVPFVAAIGFGAIPISVLPFVVFLAGATLVGGQIGITALVATLYPTKVRSTGAGWALGIGRLGAIFGPVVGGVLLSAQVPLNIIFLIASVPGFVCATLLLAIFGKSRRTVRH
jgi:AAHS family 4-hydroxybenzoate transporter-like MFS transporter